MNQIDNENTVDSSGQIELGDLTRKIKSSTKYIKSQWKYILLFSLLGGISGFLYAKFKKPTYSAICTFVLEDAKSNATGQYGGLAALAGISLGTSGGGIFEGDNILELYKSRTMIEKTLLNKYNFNGKSQLLIDRFIDFNNLRSTEKGDHKIGKVDFSGSPDKFNREQDSIVTGVVDMINKDVLSVTKPDKKLSIINVTVSSADELFSKGFTETIVQNVNDFYVQTKTKKSYQNVQILQHQADSVKSKLNYSINGVASAIEEAPNANPELSTLRVTSQKKQVDVQANTAIYSQIVQNLELAKISFRQEMPLIQVIDKPVLPLRDNHLGKIKAILIGAILGAFLTVIIIVVKKAFKLIF